MIKSWREVPEFAGAEVTDVRFDGVTIPFKQAVYDSVLAGLREIGEPVRAVVIGRGSFIEPMMAVLRTDRFLVVGDSISYWRLPVPTTAPVVSTISNKAGVSGALDIEVEGLRGHAKGFALEPLFQIIEEAGPEGMILKHPDRPNLRARPAPLNAEHQDVAPIDECESEAEVDLSESIYDEVDQRYAPDGELTILSGSEFESALGILPLKPQEVLDWSGPVRDFEDSERFAAAHMRYLGFSDAAETQAGADSGVDVECARAVAQVKFHAKPVGSPGLQNLRGVAWQKEYAIFYSLSGYTRRALDWADQNHLCLFSYTRTGTVEASNDAARALARKSRALLAQSPAAEDI
ncbi:hypothetical protein GS461_18985 [Rhodococcus hoagii]|nr:hypothetical protein [Prescottella equi]